MNVFFPLHVVLFALYNTKVLFTATIIDDFDISIIYISIYISEKLASDIPKLKDMYQIFKQLVGFQSQIIKQYFTITNYINIGPSPGP